MRYTLLFGLVIALGGCANEQEVEPTENTSAPKHLFERLPATETGVDFTNRVEETKQFNYLLYSYMYNGGGVAAGDIDNDGLVDLYLTANGRSNKLFANKGDFVFEDITATAGVADDTGWTTGACMVDINADGFLDIYVCKSGLVDEVMRRNKLFVNNGDGTFKESAADWGIDDPAYSTMAYFFDYDGDSDLDLYLLNHRIDFRENTTVDLEKQRQIDPATSDKLYRNDGERFTDVTASAGIANKAWGLSVAISDFNNDRLPDLYVCNDFRQPDHLYLNNGDGTFTDGILEHFGHTSFYSMGSDVADINQDGYPDLMVLDMVSQDHVRSKRMMAAMSPENFRRMVAIGYHHQYMFNMLHVNRGNGDFSDIGQLAGVAKTDWSWAPLFADFDNDGHSDLYITNGIRRDVTDNDYKYYVEDRFKAGNPMSFGEVMRNWPATKVPNYAYRNTGAFKFEDRTKEWGLDIPVNSNGVTYADLNNDGALDLIVNNIDNKAHIYRNTCRTNHLRLRLKGPQKNPTGIGTRVLLQTTEGPQWREQYLNRGFQSSVDPTLHFGIGNTETVRSVTVVWPDGKFEVRENVAANTTLEFTYTAAAGQFENAQPQPLFADIPPSTLGIDFVHSENAFNDFEREILLPHKQSTLGPPMAVGDMNGDGLEDFFIGNAKDAAAATYLQTPSGRFKRTNQSLWREEAKYEDTGALCLDANGDGHLDLYVVSGGNAFAQDSPLLQDRLYLNDGNGNLQRARNALPEMLTSGQCVIAEDIDDDGDTDLFVGGRLIPGAYPFPARSYVLENNAGVFSDITDRAAPELKNIGMVTDACFTDYDGDGQRDLIVVGEWTPIMPFRKTQGQYLFDRSAKGLEKSNAWWYSIAAADMDNDGDVDFVVGNLGQNNKFQPNEKKPLHVFCNDFDGNGTFDIVLSKEKGDSLLPVRGRECSSQQMPFIAQKFPTFQAFAEADLERIYGPQSLANALHYIAYDFSSVYLENLGNKSFTPHPLPSLAQFGPILDLVLEDINGDGLRDILAAGNMYNAETETIRYDASRGCVLLGDGKGAFEPVLHSGFYNFENAKKLEPMEIKGRTHYVIANQNSSPGFFTPRPQPQ